MQERKPIFQESNDRTVSIGKKSMITQVRLAQPDSLTIMPSAKNVCVVRSEHMNTTRLSIFAIVGGASLVTVNTFVCSSTSIQRPRSRRLQGSKTLQLLCKGSSRGRHLGTLFAQVWRKISRTGLEKTAVTHTHYQGIN